MLKALKNYICICICVCVCVCTIYVYVYVYVYDMYMYVYICFHTDNDPKAGVYHSTVIGECVFSVR